MGHFWVEINSRIMEEHGCSMVEAAYKVAEQLAEARA